MKKRNSVYVRTRPLGMEVLEERTLLATTRGIDTSPFALEAPGAVGIQAEVASDAVQATDVGLRMRVAYLIPANRTPQSEGVKNLRNIAHWYQDFLRDQMERYGYGSKSIVVEVESDGITPMVHVLTMPETDSYYRADDQQNEALAIYNRVLEGAAAAGIPAFVEGELWLYVHESHLQHPDGSVVGDIALGAGFGNGNSGGVGVAPASMLSFADPEGMADVRAYDGLVVPEIGPYPLKQDVSFPWFKGQTISSVISSQSGAALHELTHGLGIAHDFRNDANFHGNLMGNGLRGFRSFVWPRTFSDEHVRLGPAEALGLRFNRYLNGGESFTDNVVPAIGSFTVDPQPQEGLLEVSFTATDDVALGAALLSRNGDYVAEAPLSGNSANFTFRIPNYEPGESNSFSLAILDAQGNRANQQVGATPIVPTNRAPIPFIKASIYTARINQQVRLDASGSSDPDHALGQLSVEWDLNGDGVYDTTPTTTKSLTTAWNATEIRTIYARLSDPAGANSISAPITIRVVVPVWHNAAKPLDVNNDTHVSAGDALAVVNYINGFDAGAVPFDATEGPPFYDTTGDDNVGPNDVLAVINHINGFGIDGEGEEAGRAWPQDSGQMPAITSGRPTDALMDSDLIELLAMDTAAQPRRRR